MADSSQKKMRTVKKVLSYIKKQKLLLALSLFLSLVSVVFSLYIPVLTGDAIDLLIGEGLVSFDGVLHLLLGIGLSLAVSSASLWGMNVINNRITYRVVKDIRNDAFQRIERLPFSYLDSHQSGEIVSRVIADADQFADGLLMGFSQLFTGVLTILGTLVFMLSINPGITVFVVLATPLSILLANFIAKRTYSMFRLQSKTRGEATALIDEMIGNQKVVQAFSREEEVLSEFDEINDRLEKHSMAATFFSSLTNPTTRFINAMVYAGVTLVGALQMIGGSAAMSIGQLYCLLGYVNQYTKPFNEISGVFAELQNSIACAARVLDLIEAEPEPPDALDAIKMEKAEGNVLLSSVSFSYTEERPLIEDLNLAVTHGSRVAIVGPTGCGKTTLINLLMRFYDVKGGSISVDGHDIRTLTRETLRAQYGMVLQETWLRSGTVMENIAMGKPDATEEQIIAAAKMSHAHSFIKRLPEGYNTRLEGEGAGLSQGEKQLLCIARVMLSLPPMLILDEATSSIDTRTELLIQKAFSEMMKGRTSFIVAHRLSTIKEADVILVMRDGRIIEQGTHEALLQKGGFYRELYQSQFSH